jgi:fumarate hydratase, class I
MCQDTGTAIVMGKKGQLVSPAAATRRRSRAASSTPTRRRTCATRSSRRSTCTREEHRHEPARADRALRDDGDAYKFLFMAKGGGSANKSYSSRRPRRSSTRRACAVPSRRSCAPRHRGVPALSPRDRHRRHERRAHAEDGEARVGALPRRAAHERQRLGRGFRDLELEPRSSRSRAHRHRRAVRRQVLLPRRARHPPAAPRRECPVAIAVSCSADRQALGKITRDGVFLEELEHDPAKYLPETHEARPRRRGREDRSLAPDERDPRDALALPDQDAPLALRADDRRARHRAREAQGAARSRRGLPDYMKDHMRLLRGSGEDARRATPRAPSARRPPGAWTATSTSSRHGGRW